MSKWYEEKVDEDGIKRRYIEIGDENDCTHKYNDVCCCDKSEKLGDYPFKEYCDTCPYFLKEEQVKKIIKEEIENDK